MKARPLCRDKGSKPSLGTTKNCWSQQATSIMLYFKQSQEVRKIPTSAAVYQTRDCQ